MKKNQYNKFEKNFIKKGLIIKKTENRNDLYYIENIIKKNFDTKY